MDNEEEVNDETLEVEDEPELETLDEEEEDVDTLRTRLAKAEELANNYKVRAEKAEKGKPKQTAVKQDSSLSTKDILALSKAQIDDEDLDEVLDYAAYKKLPIHEALKSTVLKATLTEKAELRKSAQAVNTGSTRRAGTAVSDERIIADARKGIMPESEEDMVRLARLRLQKK
jgi:hypothetical protein